MSILNHLKKYRSAIARTATSVALAVCTVLSVFAIMQTLNTVCITAGTQTVTFKTNKSETSELLTLGGFEEGTYVLNGTEKDGNKINIDITNTFPVYVTLNKKTTEVTFAGGTVKDVIALAGITLDKHDIVSLPLTADVSDTEYIDIVDVDYKKETYTDKSTNTIVTCERKLVNGNVVETQILSTKPAYVTEVKPAVKTNASVAAMSTLMPETPIVLDENNCPVNYTKHLTVTATAYTYTGNNCSTGVAPQPGYIAVNPKFIPYGTKMFIKSSDGSYMYGYAVAADTGGFTKQYPYNVDLFMTSEAQCVAFGRRSVEIYIIG